MTAAAAPSPLLDAFGPPVEVPGVAWPVRRRGSGPPVVVLHELNGVTPPVVACATRIADAGFTVYLPALAGPVPAVTGAEKKRAAWAICVSREIHLLRTGRTSPAVAGVRALARWAVEQGGAPRGAGVVGMCFSGGFAMAAAVDPAVTAAVVAEPSLPVFFPPACARDLGMDAGDVTALRDRLASGATDLYVTRFSRDFISPRAKAATIARTFGVAVHEIESGADSQVGIGKEHSVLSLAPTHYEPGSAARRRLDEAFDEVVAFLHDRLG